VFGTRTRKSTNKSKSKKSRLSRHRAVTRRLLRWRHARARVTHALVGLEPRRVDVEVHIQAGFPASRSSVSSTGPCRRRSTASAAVSRRRSWSGRTVASRSISRRRNSVRKAPASTCRLRSRFSPRRGRFPQSV
jgi:hypothetical protein